MMRSDGRRAQRALGTGAVAPLTSVRSQAWSRSSCVLRSVAGRHEFAAIRSSAAGDRQDRGVAKAITSSARSHKDKRNRRRRARRAHTAASQLPARAGAAGAARPARRSGADAASRSGIPRPNRPAELSSLFERRACAGVGRWLPRVPHRRASAANAIAIERQH